MDLKENHLLAAYLLAIALIYSVFMFTTYSQETYEIKPHEAALGEAKEQQGEGDAVFTVDTIRIDRIRIEPNPTLYYSRFDAEGTEVVSGLSMAVGFVFELKADPKLSYILAQVLEYDTTGISTQGTDVVKTNIVPITIADWTSLQILEVFPTWDKVLGHLNAKVKVELADDLGNYVRRGLLVEDVTGIASDPKLSDIITKTVETLTLELDPPVIEEDIEP
jgi:hypothetical protein